MQFKVHKLSLSGPMISAPFIDFPMFYIKYLALHKMQMHEGAIRKLLYGLYGR